MKNKNVLIIAANGLGKSGVPNVIYQVVRALYKSVIIDVVYFNDDDFYKQKLLDLGVNVIGVNTLEPKGVIRRFLWRLFSEKHRTDFVFRNIFRSKKYDAVHSFKEYDSAYIFALAKKCGINDIILHCNNEIKPPKNIISKLLFQRKRRLIYKHSTCLIGVSNECCSKSYPKMPFTVLFNTYDEKMFNFNVLNKLNENELVLTQIATFSSRKNQLFTLEVLKKMTNLHSNVILNLIGFEVEQGYLHSIEEHIRNMHISEHVKIIDGTNGIGDFLEKTTFILLPSLSEAAPISLVEAQACGITCFASDKITRDMNCGGINYISLDDSDAWANQIYSKFLSLGNKRIKFDMSRFSSNAFKRHIKEIYGIK